MKDQNSRPEAESGEGFLGPGSELPPTRPDRKLLQQESVWNPDCRCILDALTAHKMRLMAENVILL